LPVGLVVGHLVVGESLAWLGVRVLICYLSITGARKADVALDPGVVFGLRHLSLWHAVWDFRGVITSSPTLEQLSSLCSNCYVYLTPVPCKNDQDGTLYGGTPTPARYSATAPVNFAREFAAYERMRMVPAALRRTTPLLLGPDGATPWRKRQLDAFFHALLLAIMPEEQARAYSVHSFRIYLACALFSLGASSDRILRMLRWASVKSLLVYARPNASDTANWLEAAGSATIHGARTHTLADAAAHGSQLSPALRCASATVSAATAAASAAVAQATAAVRAAALSPAPRRNATPVLATRVPPTPAPPDAGSPAAGQRHHHEVSSEGASLWLRGAPLTPGLASGAQHSALERGAWLTASAPPLPMDDACAWAEALLSVLDVDIATVDRSAVPPTDDDAVLANWHAQMPALERAAAAMDAAGSESAEPAGGSYAPGASDSNASDSPDDGEA
jgi:hypothetical protein